MKYFKFIILFFFFSLSFSSFLPAQNIENISLLDKKAINIVKKFSGKLKPKLLQAIESGGFQNAISICSEEAPKIANQLSEETGWHIKRVSLKPRNTDSATADEFEQAILIQFNQRQANGEKPDSIIHSEIIDNQYRFMKAQAVQPLCMNCHGNAIAPDVINTIKQYYPNDIATGYSQGEIRGAFSLIKDLK